MSRPFLVLANLLHCHPGEVDCALAPSFPGPACRRPRTTQLHLRGPRRFPPPSCTHEPTLTLFPVFPSFNHDHYSYYTRHMKRSTRPLRYTIRITSLHYSHCLSDTPPHHNPMVPSFHAYIFPNSRSCLVYSFFLFAPTHVDIYPFLDLCRIENRDHTAHY